MASHTAATTQHVSPRVLQQDHCRQQQRQALNRARFPMCKTAAKADRNEKGRQDEMRDEKMSSAGRNGTGSFPDPDEVRVGRKARKAMTRGRHGVTRHRSHRLRLALGAIIGAGNAGSGRNSPCQHPRTGGRHQRLLQQHERPAAGERQRHGRHVQES